MSEFESYPIFIYIYRSATQSTIRSRMKCICPVTAEPIRHCFSENLSAGFGMVFCYFLEDVGCLSPLKEWQAPEKNEWNLDIKQYEYMYYFVFSMYVLEAQLLSNGIDVTHSLLHSFTPSLRHSRDVWFFRAWFRCFESIWTLFMVLPYNLMRKPFLKVSWHIPVFFFKF